jgi:hypothetical protein
MAVSDFLVNGNIPAGSAVTSTTSQTVLPDWYSNYAMDLLAKQSAVSALPYQPAPMPRVAGFTPAQQQGFDMTGQAATAYQPALGAAMAKTADTMQAPTGLSAAQPYFNQAGQTSVANIGQYMNPYTNDVVNRIADLGTRNLTENIMPAIEGRYIGAGQLGGATRGGGLSAAPSGMLTDTARAVRDTNADILAQQSAALQSGYNGALTASAADLSRMGQLGATAGNLANADVTSGLNTASTMANLGQQAQQQGLTGASAVTGVGAQQQALNQQNLDAARADFLAQRGYTQDQINNALATFKGVYSGVPSSTSQEGIVPNAVPTTSTAQNIGSGLALGAGALSALQQAGLLG